MRELRDLDNELLVLTMKTYITRKNLSDEFATFAVNFLCDEVKIPLDQLDGITSRLVERMKEKK